MASFIDAANGSAIVSNPGISTNGVSSVTVDFANILQDVIKQRSGIIKDIGDGDGQIEIDGNSYDQSSMEGMMALTQKNTDLDLQWNTALEIFKDMISRDKELGSIFK